MTLAARSAFLTAVVVAAIATTDASAALIQRQSFHNAGSACTGALPTYEGALRKRPRAIANEGATTAFVTCSMNTEELSATRSTYAAIRLFNAGTSAAAVSCTFVNGADWEGAINDTQTVNVPAGGSAFALWGSAAADAPVFTRWGVNFSCALPPGVGVSYVGRRFRQDVGAL